MWVRRLCSSLILLLIISSTPPLFYGQTLGGDTTHSLSEALRQSRTAVSTPSPYSAPPLGFSGFSVDAIAVYERQVNISGTLHQRIYYSFYGHYPKVPVPYDNITEWNWWTLAGNQSAMLPNLGSGDDTNPQIAFSREGKAMAVWSHEFQNGTCTYNGTTTLLFQRDIWYTIWDGSSWSAPGLAASLGFSDNFADQPAVAFDNDGAGLLIYIHRQTTRNPDCSAPAPPTYAVNIKHWIAPNWIGDRQMETPGPFNQIPEVAFIAEDATAPTPLSAHKAVAAWWSAVDSAVIDCSPFGTITTPLYWVKAAVWDGATFGASAEIPGRPPSPPPYSMLAGHKVGVSPDKRGNARVVWDPLLQMNPCPPMPTAPSLEVWSAYYNGTAARWQGPAKLDNGANPPNGKVTADVTHLENDTAIAVYANSSSGLLWSKYTTAWSSPASVDSAQAGHPSIATLQRNRTLVVYTGLVSGIVSILFSVLDTTSGNANWSSEATLIVGGDNPAIAANTGSPTMPQAEWTLMGYLDGDNNLDPYIQNNFNQLRAEGSNQLVNLVVLEDRSSSPPDSLARLKYVEKGRFIEWTVAGFTPSELDMSNPATLTNFIAWTLQNYPASRYLLIIRDHGGGSVDSGTGRFLSTVDDSTPGSKGMDLLKTSSALRDSGIGLLRDRVILGFDECLQAGVERAYELRKYATHMIAAEECTPASGWPYDKLAARIKSHPFQSNAGIAADTVSVYESQFPAPPISDGLGATLSAIGLDQVASLKTSVDNLASLLIANWKSQYKGILDARRRSQNVNVSSSSDTPDYYIDLGNFTSLLQEEPGLPAAIATAAGATSLAVSKAITARTGVVHYFGLTIYFERFKDPTLYEPFYSSLAFSTGSDGWDEFLQLRLPLEVTAQPSSSSYTPPATVNITGTVRSPLGTANAATIRLLVTTPGFSTFLTKTVLTTAAGIYTASFSLPQRAPQGNYTVIVTASEAGFYPGTTITIFNVRATPNILFIAIILTGIGTIIVLVALRGRRKGVAQSSGY